jgi:hypothetical protein
MVFDNVVLGSIFGRKRDEVTGGWRKLHNEEFHNSYSSPSIIRITKSRGVRWAGHVEKRNVYRTTLGKPEGRRQIGRLRCKWVNNIKMHLREIAGGSVEWIGLAQNREQRRTLVDTVMNLRVPQYFGKFLTCCTSAQLHEVSYN